MSKARTQGSFSFKVCMNHSASVVSFRRPDERWRAFDAEEFQFPLEVVRHVLCAVVVADRDTAGDAVRESPEATAHALADGFQRFETGRAGGGVEADALGGEVVDRDRLKARRRPGETYPGDPAAHGGVSGRAGQGG